MEEYRRGDVVRHVSDYNEWLVDEIGEAHLQDIRLHDGDPPIARVPLAQPLREHVIDLDDYDATGARKEKLGERSPSRSNLDDDVIARSTCGIGDVL